MNKILILLSVVLFISCTTFYPVPESPSDSLVIGYVEYDFPDGFFNMPPKLLRTGIKVNYTNLSTGQDLYCKSNYGYFRFVCDGNAEILIKSAEYRYDGMEQKITLSPIEINQKIQLVEQKVIYLGHLNVTYSLPEVEGREYQPEQRGDKTIYNYDINMNVEVDRVKLKQYFIENFIKTSNYFNTSW